jgi:tripartite-type tricarboxylate transporter receptor subunit TctC
MHKDPELPEIPLALDLVKGAEQTQIVKLFVATQVLARPFAAPPGVPADRQAILRTAFDETLKDPDFLAEASKLGLDINPITGSSIDTLLGEIYATPKDVVARAAAAIAE